MSNLREISDYSISVSAVL